MTEAELIRRQVEIEERVRKEAIERSRKAVLKALDSGKANSLSPVHRFISAALETTTRCIDEIKAARASGSGAKFKKIIRFVDSDILAAGGLTILLNSMASSNEHSNLAQNLMVELGTFVHTEWMVKQIDSTAPAYLSKVVASIQENNTINTNHIRRTMIAAKKRLGGSVDDMTTQDFANLGRHIVRALYETGIFRWLRAHNGMLYAVPVDEVEAIFTDVLEHADGMVHYPPMICKPAKHTDFYSGGYLTHHCMRNSYTHRSLLRSEREEVEEAFKNAPLLLEAMNKAQEVPYVINKHIFSLIQKARAIGFNVGMPSTVPKPKPVLSIDGIPKDTWTEAQCDIFEEWKIAIRDWYKEDRTRKAAIRANAITYDIVGEYRDAEALYFPTFVDWRYRLYYKPSFHPQMGDLQKSLLLMQRAKPLGKRGLYWLKVHVATCFGFDKKRMDARAQWTDDRIEIIRDWVRNPFGNSSFDGADSFWCMLAGATDLINALDSDDPESFVSGVPVAMDATNSGGQHFSAFLRDSIGGELTNLFDNGGDSKADLYMAVKNITEELMQQDRSDVDAWPFVQYWTENPITRSMTKRPTMTFFYSATFRSCMKYLYLGAMDEDYKKTDDFSLIKACAELTKWVRPAIAKAMPAAAAAQQYLQKLSRRMPDGAPVRWTTPLGGLVINKYATKKENRLNVRSMNIHLVTIVNYDKHTNCVSKAAQGIAPNMVHSLDSTHLMMCILRHTGDLMNIHDSMATVPADVDEMHTVIRRAFYDLYKDYDPIEVLTKYVADAGGDLEDLPRPPKGDLDLSLVLGSEFFFC